MNEENQTTVNMVGCISETGEFIPYGSTGGGASTGTPVYIFDDKDAYEEEKESILSPALIITLNDSDSDATGGGGWLTVDDVLSELSENPVQNKVIKSALDAIKIDVQTIDSEKADIISRIEQLENNMSKYYRLIGGSEIPEGADLDTYKTAGSYYIDSDRYVSSLLNCPVASAFTMKVEMLKGTSVPAQTIINTNGVIYWRYFVIGPGRWIDWKKIAFESI